MKIHATVWTSPQPRQEAPGGLSAVVVLGDVAAIEQARVPRPSGPGHEDVLRVYLRGGRCIEMVGDTSDFESLVDVLADLRRSDA